MGLQQQVRLICAAVRHSGFAKREGMKERDRKAGKDGV